MSQTKQSSGLPYPVKLIVGLGLMAGGFWASETKPAFLSFQEKLAEQGIPLDLGITVAVIGVFMILFPVINIFYLKPLVEAIGSRNSELEATFTEAENLKAEMAKMRSEYEARLVQTEADARAKIEANIKEAQNLRQTLLAEATEKADAKLKEADREIEAQKAQVMVQLRTSVVDLSLQAAEKVIGANMDSERNRKMVADFIANAEVKA